MTEGKTHFVYWIRRAIHTDIDKEGYVGVTKDKGRRWREHVTNALSGKHYNPKLRRSILKYRDQLIITAVEEGAAATCYAREAALRPTRNIGWNISPGGKRGPDCTGRKMSDEFKQRRSEHMKGNTRGARNNAPKSAEHRAKIAAANKGKPKPPMTAEEKVRRGEHLRRWRAVNGHRPMGAAARQRLSEARKGKPLSDEHRAALAAARTKYNAENPGWQKGRVRSLAAIEKQRASILAVWAAKRAAKADKPTDDET